jgi:hypothetical protein
MSLKITQANKTFDQKLRLVGYEVFDLVVLFITLSVLNFIFAEGFKLLCVWLPVLILAIILRVGKRGKPENYIVHLIKFHVSPGVYCAFTDPKLKKSPPKIRKASST